MTRRTPPRGFALGGVLAGVLAVGVALAGAFVLDAAPLGAQTPARDTARFFGRPGHWALEGAAGATTSGLGALYFVGRRTAFGLDFSGRYTYTRHDAAGGGVSDLASPGSASSEGASSESIQAGATLAAGVRRYMPLRACLAAVGTAGVLLEYTSIDNERTTLRYGPFADAGLAFRVAPRLAVNALVRASLARTEQLDAERVGSVDHADLVRVNGRARGWSADLARARVAVTLFF